MGRECEPIRLYNHKLITCILLFSLGIIGLSDCPYHSNSIIIYLILSGCVVAIFITVRTIPSVMTCCRNRNYCNTRESGSFTACICLFEVLFYIVATINSIVLVLGSIITFRGTNPTKCSETVETDCCHTYVFVSSAFFNVFQYIMYTITVLYVCLVVCCVRKMDKVYGRR